jgi:hypothetical protein
MSIPERTSDCQFSSSEPWPRRPRPPERPELRCGNNAPPFSTCLLINVSFYSKQVIAAEGEQKASHALRDAAMVIQQSPAALQVQKTHRHSKSLFISTETE